jgi:hypothetical protein
MAKLDGLKVTQLRELAKQKGIRGYSGMRKAQLIRALQKKPRVAIKKKRTKPIAPTSKEQGILYFTQFKDTNKHGLKYIEDTFSADEFDRYSNDVKTLNSWIKNKLLPGKASDYSYEDPVQDSKRAARRLLAQIKDPKNPKDFRFGLYRPHLWEKRRAGASWQPGAKLDEEMDCQELYDLLIEPFGAKSVGLGLDDKIPPFLNELLTECLRLWK